MLMNWVRPSPSATYLSLPYNAWSHVELGMNGINAAAEVWKIESQDTVTLTTEVNNRFGELMRDITWSEWHSRPHMITLFDDWTIVYEGVDSNTSPYIRVKLSSDRKSFEVSYRTTQFDEGRHEFVFSEPTLLSATLSWAEIERQTLDAPDIFIWNTSFESYEPD